MLNPWWTKIDSQLNMIGWGILGLKYTCFVNPNSFDKSKDFLQWNPYEVSTKMIDFKFLNFPYQI